MLRGDMSGSSELIIELQRGRFGQWKQNVPLSQLSYWAVGGTADLIIRPTSTSQIIELINFLYEKKIDYITVGRATNLLFSSKGVRCVCIQLLDNFSKIRIEENILEAASGAWAPRIALEAARLGLTGIEHIVGIPGTLGGLVTMNGGSLRQNIGDSIVQVTSLTPEGDILVRNAKECDFGYRQSVFKSSDEIILSASIRLTPAKRSEAFNRALDILKTRKKKFPLKLPNCGSVFISDPTVYEHLGPAGRMIEDCGLKGFRIGNAEVSQQHANFIVNHGSATSNDILSLIYYVRNKVAQRSGISLRTEPLYVQENGTITSIDAFLDKEFTQNDTEY